jgi:hypothetical protein
MLQAEVLNAICAGGFAIRVTLPIPDLGYNQKMAEGTIIGRWHSAFSPTATKQNFAHRHLLFAFEES